MSSRGFQPVYFMLVLIILIGSSASASVHTEPGPRQQSASDQPPAASDAESPTARAESKSPPQSELDQLKARIDKMQTLLEEQQRTIAEMVRRLDSGAAKVQTTALTLAPSTGANPSPSPVVETIAGGAIRVSPDASVSSQGKPEEKPAPLAGWDRGRAVLRSADGSFETFVTGYAQFDYRGYQSGNVPPATFLIRRARLVLEGKVQRYFDFKIEGDFADTTSTLLRDFYLRIHRKDELQLSFGQFRVPISQEEIRPDAVQDFVERSLVNNLVPSRSPGMMASGIIGKGVFEYQVGAFNGKRLLANNNNDTPEGVLRLRFSPWKNSKEFWTRGLAFGGAYSQGRSLLGTSFRGQTESRSFTFFAPDIVNGQINRANGELTWLLGPATFRAEYDQTSQERENLGPLGRTLPGVIGKGSAAQFTYLLTGETKPDASPLTPKKGLFGEGNGGPGFGAWELKFRYANLQISDATAKNNRAETFYFGVNWYLNRYVRNLVDIGIERFGDPARTPKPGDNNFLVFLSRFQVSF